MTKPRTKDVETLRALEESLWQRETRFDPEWMENVLADDCVEIGRSGRVHSRATILDAEPREIDAVLPLPGFEVRMLAADVALVTYATSVGTDDAIEHARRASIWSRDAGRWQLRFHQGTPVPGRGNA